MNECLLESEKEALKEFKKNSIYGSCQISEKDCLKFLAARKFNVQRALELYISHQNTRDKEDLLDLNPWDEEVKRELISAKLTVFPEGDHEGATVLLLTANLHFPNLTTHRAVLKGLVVQLDCALESLEAQRKGVVLIYDMTNSKFQNFDYELSKKILNMLKGSYPARLKKVLIVMAPLWFKAPFKVLRHFILEKLRKRVHVIHPADLLIHLPLSSIPFQLGGTLRLDHRAWITKCLNSAVKYDHHKFRLLPRILDPVSGNHLSLNNFVEKQIDMYFDGMCDDPFACGVGNGASSSVTTGDSVSEEISEGNAVSLPTLSSTSSLACPKTDSCLESDEDIYNYDCDDHVNKAAEDKEGSDECNMDDNVLHVSLCASKGINSRQDEIPHVGSRKRSASLSEDVESAKRRPTSNKNGKDNKVLQQNAFNDDYSLSDESSSDESSENMEQDLSNQTSRVLSPVQMFGHWMAVGHQGIQDEFFTLASEPPTGSLLACRMKANRHRNRYSDIPCLDETRVRLLESSPDGSDYIHANFVDGYNKEKAFISTQGPLQRTLDDFWQMVWEQAVLVVVMTTRTIERGRIKCDQYWPTDPNAAEQYGKIVVVNSGIELKDEFITTTLILQNIETKEARELKHVHFVGWPDHGTPSSADAFLDVLEYVNCVQEEQVLKHHNSRPDLHPERLNPILVHCSAGIGRTGTFIALDILTRSLKDTGGADIQGTIRKIRNQRALSIQTPEQYLFCYEALICYAKRVGLFGHASQDDAKRH